MAATLTLAGDWLISMGDRRMTKGTGNLGTYATNGVAITAAKAGLGQIQDFVVDPAAGYVFSYVKSTGKVLAYISDDAVDPLDEVANETDLAAITFNFRAIGQ